MPNKYETLFIQSFGCKGRYSQFSRTTKSDVLAFCFNNEILSSSCKIDDWLENSPDPEFWGFYIIYKKTDTTICLEGDEDLFNNGNALELVCLPIQEFKTLVTRWRQLVKEYPPAITLDWKNSHPTLTPWYNVDLSEYYGESSEDKK